MEGTERTILYEPLNEKLIPIFLERLDRMAETLARCRRDPIDARVLMALNKAIYSTYMDLVRSGKGEEAREILRRYNLIQ